MQKKGEMTVEQDAAQRENSYSRRLKKQLADIKDYILCPEDEYPALYVGTYFKYNCGSIFGAWIDLTACADYEEFMDVCHHLHADEQDPELMFQDFMYFPERWYTESGITEEVFDKIIFWFGLSEDKQKAYEEFMWLYSDEDYQHFENSYIGDYKSEEEYAREYAEDNYPSFARSALASFIDYEKFADELFSLDLSFSDGHVFRDNY